MLKYHLYIHIYIYIEKQKAYPGILRNSYLDGVDLILKGLSLSIKLRFSKTFAVIVIICEKNILY